MFMAENMLLKLTILHEESWKAYQLLTEPERTRRNAIKASEILFALRWDFDGSLERPCLRATSNAAILQHWAQETNSLRPRHQNWHRRPHDSEVAQRTSCENRTRKSVPRLCRFSQDA